MVTIQGRESVAHRGARPFEGIALAPGVPSEGPPQLEALSAQKPSTTQVFLHYAEDITVHVPLPLPRSPELRNLLKRYFDSVGQLQGATLQALQGGREKARSTSRETPC